MECSQIRLKLDEYIRNRLDDDMAKRIAFHLQNCLPCTEEFNILKEINDILNVEKPVFAGNDFTMKVMKRIESESTNTRKFIFSRLPIINLGASLILTGFLTVFASIPSVSSTIDFYRNTVTSKAQMLNYNISITTNEVQSYVKNIINFGGK